ncbi:LPXTG cell wall anchor domain-containing protein [Streptomyces sp. NBC_01476]|uniref:LAETG motif-containing sortase-dependent surface protein n=1 Tax=Streptomyces sp. NBC_01476 TaxID=2903881 RepID=UPI002E35C2C8|nr:LAETG motif-containing sortase-dependent surface protein [Streptomyces sp. NBC_01476]
MTVALSVAGVGAAQAHNGGSSDKCGQVSVKFSLDGGKHWTTNGRIDGGKPPTTITVKFTGNSKQGCEYPVSLASYSAEGPDWAHSGTQAFLGWDTATLSSKNKQATLDISDVAPTCFGQVDLYGNGTKYDGTEGKLPHYPDSATPTQLITAWNGGQKCDTPPTTPPASPTDSATPTPSDSTSATPTPSDSTSATPTPSDSTSASPSTSPSDSGSPSPSVSDTASPSPSATTPAAGGGSVTPPTGTPVVSPVSSTPTGNLAETGGNGSQTVAFAGGGAALLVIGGGAVYFTRRRNRTAGN